VTLAELILCIKSYRRLRLAAALRPWDAKATGSAPAGRDRSPGRAAL